jgi:urease accessory protein
MLTIHKRCEPRQSFDAELVLPFELRQKTRLRTRTTMGEEAGLFLPRGSNLRDGDFLEAQDGRIVRVTAKSEQVLEIGCADAVQLARIAHHLGNRHVAVQVGHGWLRIASDDVLRQMVEGLGGIVVSMESAFEPEGGAYAGHHHQSADAPLHRGIIHHYASSEP